MTAVLAGFAAAALATAAVGELLAAGAPALRERLPLVLRRALALVDAVVRAGREGRDPGAAERRRLLTAGAATAAVAGWIVVGPPAGLALGAAAPWSVARLLRARREHYRRRVDAGAGTVAIALADALAAGHSLPGAIAECEASIDGQTGHELRRTAAELAAGARTADALASLRERTGSRRLAVIVAACLVQHGAGGDLARLLRECAEGFADQARLEDEVRAATAQARFTGLVVVLLPLGGALLAELASPGFAAGLASSFLTAWLVGLAIAMQVAAAFLIRRLGRVSW
ncbi:MAG TPA: type II secretion system F family protein [Solirubrobacteraceae bacterium]|nr:type II secretion system F family protein [Solirubrobacteraceae bacterium]